MDLERLIAVLKSYKPHVIAEGSGLSRQQVYNLLSGKEENPKYQSIKALSSFLMKQHRAIDELNIQEIS
jgi:DNA-binding phage protein